MPNFNGNNESYDEIVFNFLIDFDQMKERLGDKADIEILLAKYPENIRDNLRKEVQDFQQITQGQTPEKAEAMLPSLMAKIHGTLGEQVRLYQERQRDPIYIQELVQKGNINLAAMEQSSIALSKIRDMNRNERLRLGKQFGLTTNNLQLIQLWLDWLDTLAY